MDTMWFYLILVIHFSSFFILSCAKTPPKLDDFTPKRLQNVGTKFRIFCSLNEGTSPFQFVWTRNGRLLSISDSRYQIETTLDNSVLTIPSLSLDDTDSNFTCSVRNEVGSDFKSTILIVKG